MAALEKVITAAYIAPSKGRRYLTARAAAKAEAGAIIEARYPTERGDITDGFYNWHWSADDHLVKVHRRLTRMLLRKLKVDYER